MCVLVCTCAYEFLCVVRVSARVRRECVRFAWARENIEIEHGVGATRRQLTEFVAAEADAVSIEADAVAGGGTLTFFCGDEDSAGSMVRSRFFVANVDPPPDSPSPLSSSLSSSFASFSSPTVAAAFPAAASAGTGSGAAIACAVSTRQPILRGQLGAAALRTMPQRARKKGPT